MIISQEQQGVFWIAMNEKEEELCEFVFPIFRKYWETLRTDSSYTKCILIVSEKSLRASHATSPIDRPDIYETKYHLIGLPAKDVEKAKLNTKQYIPLYSGKKIDVSAMTYLYNMIAHEITHCFYDGDESDLNEAIAMKTGWQNVIQDASDGELYVACEICIVLIEAHILGYLNIQNISELTLPYKFSNKCLNLMQNELDAYFSDQEMIKQEYLEKKVLNNHLFPYPYGDYEDNYSKGFVRLVTQQD